MCRMSYSSPLVASAASLLEMENSAHRRAVVLALSKALRRMKRIYFATLREDFTVNPAACSAASPTEVMSPPAARPAMKLSGRAAFEMSPVASMVFSIMPSKPSKISLAALAYIRTSSAMLSPMLTSVMSAFSAWLALNIRIELSRSLRT